MTNVTTDYAHLLTLPAGAELRRAVAELAGWTVKPIEIWFGTAWQLFDPKGEISTRPYEPDGLDYWTDLDDENAFAPYDTDTDAALTLVNDLKCTWSLNYVTPVCRDFSIIYFDEANKVSEFEGDGPTPALAIVRAFIRWKAAQE